MDGPVLCVEPRWAPTAVRSRGRLPDGMPEAVAARAAEMRAAGTWARSGPRTGAGTGEVTLNQAVWVELDEHGLPHHPAPGLPD